jgi:tRNA (guanosine-2'-O-)-methyltransferase
LQWCSKWVDINTFDSITDVDTLKNKGYQIIATTPHDDDCVMEDFDISKQCLIFLGRNATLVGRNFSVLMVS